MTEIFAQDLARRYAEVWNEPDAELRRKAIREVWAQDGAHILHAPEEIRKLASELGFDSTVLEIRGHDALEVRVTRAYEEFVAPGEYVFRARDNAVRLHDVVKFHWEMVPVGGGEPAGGGLEVVVVDDSGHIAEDYQFPGG